MKLEDLKRDDLIMGGIALLLFIGLLAFPWFEVSYGIGPYSGSVSEAATGSPDSFAGIIALILVVLLFADLAIQRFAPQVQLPELGGSREATRFFIAVAVMVFIALKFVLEIQFSDFGWGFYLDVILGAALIFFTIQARRLASPTVSAGPTPTA